VHDAVHERHAHGLGLGLGHRARRRADGRRGEPGGSASGTGRDGDDARTERLR
jgi:hypothetical protein